MTVKKTDINKFNACYCDSENDLSLFENVKYKIAMGNAVLQIKKRADFVTSTNNDEGVNKILSKIVKNI